MLTHIQIRDFAIIDAVELELGAGLTVLTGETGAGKSILVDALLLAAGGRAGAEVVRHGAERAEVSATFSVDGNAAGARLAGRAVDRARRRMRAAPGRRQPTAARAPTSTGRRCRCRRCGSSARRWSMCTARWNISRWCAARAQRELLDRSGEHASARRNVAERWRALVDAARGTRRGAASAQDREARLELLRYHLSELQGARPEAR